MMVRKESLEVTRPIFPRQWRRAACAVWVGVLLLSGCSGDETATPAPDGAAAIRDPQVTTPNPPRVGNNPPLQAAETKPHSVFRPEDDRPQHDDAKLAELGIRRYESRRLILYTDIDPEMAAPLPPLMDEAYAAWEEYFGPLPPNQAGTDYQMTGYIMADRRPFIEAGLLPDDLPDFPHGRHRGAEFWMNDQEHDYYRRHLMIHEGTHCFMTTMPNVLAPSWYMEGMAELFGTHLTGADGRTKFRVMPAHSLDVRGWGRLQIIAQDVAAGQAKSLTDVFTYGHNAFLQVESYAWSWALCKFLDTHPRYRERFRELGGYLQGTQFIERFRELYRVDESEMNREWALFAAGLDYGFDIDRAAIDFRAAKPLTVGHDATVDVAADDGWQSTGVIVEAGAAYELTATGRVAVAQQPQPWISTPAGITIRYHAGRPLGTLTAVVLPDNATTVAPGEIVTVGEAAVLKPQKTGTLLLRVNDNWSELSDNTGDYHVRIARESKSTNP